MCIVLLPSIQDVSFSGCSQSCINSLSRDPNFAHFSTWNILKKLQLIVYFLLQIILLWEYHYLLIKTNNFTIYTKWKQSILPESKNWSTHSNKISNYKNPPYTDITTTRTSAMYPYHIQFYFAIRFLYHRTKCSKSIQQDKCSLS